MTRLPGLRGPFYSVKQVYDLDFGAFVVGAHLKGMSDFQASAKGLDINQTNLELLLADPKDDGGAIKHDMTASITPDFRGLQGTVTIRANPVSRLLPVVSAVGVKLYGIFLESASSASNDLSETWTRIRRARVGIQPDTKAPIYATQSDPVQVKLIRNTGDETSDTDPTGATVMVLAGVLKVGDILRGLNTYVCVNVQPGSDFDQADLRLG